jgi:hypothetical protein
VVSEVGEGVNNNNNNKVLDNFQCKMEDFLVLQDLEDKQCLQEIVQNLVVVVVVVVDPLPNLRNHQLVPEKNHPLQMHLV